MLMARPVLAAATSRSVWRDRKAGICSTSTASAVGAHCSGKCTSVSTGQPVFLAHLGEDRQARLQAQAALAVDRGAVGLVERGLIDQADAELAGQLDQRVAHLQRMGAAFEHARPGDQGQRPVVADGDVADGDGARRGHGAIISKIASNSGNWLRFPLELGSFWLRFPRVFRGNRPKIGFVFAKKIRCPPAAGIRQSQYNAICVFVRSR